MPHTLQTILVLIIVLACATFVCAQFVRTLAGSKSKLGSCCNKGCAPPEKKEPSKPAEQFIASDSLVRSVRNRGK
jgi:hypothetical protein